MFILLYVKKAMKSLLWFPYVAIPYWKFTFLPTIYQGIKSDSDSYELFVQFSFAIFQFPFLFHIEAVLMYCVLMALNVYFIILTIKQNILHNKLHFQFVCTKYVYFVVKIICISLSATDHCSLILWDCLLLLRIFLRSHFSTTWSYLTLIWWFQSSELNF